jgi:hypothetical protein
MNSEEMRIAALRASRLAADLNDDEFGRARRTGERARPCGRRRPRARGRLGRSPVRRRVGARRVSSSTSTPTRGSRLRRSRSAISQAR